MNSRIKELAKAVQENPEDSFYKFTLALEMIKFGSLNKAKILFEDIRTKDPDYVGVYYHLGKLYEQLGEIEKALNTFKDGKIVAEKLKDQHTLSELSAALFQLELETEE